MPVTSHHIMSRQLGVFSMKSHKDVLTAQSNQSCFYCLHFAGRSRRAGYKSKYEGCLLVVLYICSKNPPESLLLIYFHKCCISAYFQTAWLFCYIICLVVFAYLIIFHLFLKGLTWEAGRERRQRRAGKRCKHIADKMIVFGQLS